MGCDLPSGNPPERERAVPIVVIDTLETIQDGGQISWEIHPGRYALEMTASGDGAGVEWIGAICGGARETRVFASRCELDRTGQLVISNPTTFKLGDSTTVTVKVTKLPE